MRWNAAESEFSVRKKQPAPQPPKPAKPPPPPPSHPPPPPPKTLLLSYEQSSLERLPPPPASLLRDSSESSEAASACDRDSLEGEETEGTLTPGKAASVVSGHSGDGSSIGEQQDKDIPEEIVVEMPTRVVFKDPEAKKTD